MNNKHYFSHSGSEVMIAHFPGQTRENNEQLMSDFSERKFKVPDNLDILSVITEDMLDSCILHKQLVNNGTEYINPALGMCFQWSMIRKIRLILKGLSECTKEYCLILDGADVSILTDLTDIIPRYKEYGVDILYNATIWLHPKELLDIVENRGQYGRYCYLNAGCCIGKVEDLKWFYERTCDIVLKSRSSSLSEQFYIRKAFDRVQDRVFFDHKCSIFQVWHAVQETVKGNNVYLD